jgi:hypothetical protein
VQSPEILSGVKISSKCHFSPVGCHKRGLLKYSFLHLLQINKMYHDDSYQWSLVQRYARWLERQITFGWINYKVIRIRAKYISAHGKKNKMPLFAVLLREVFVRFTAILLRGFAKAVLLRGVACVVPAQLNTCFIMWQMFHKQPSQVRGNTWFRTRVCVRRCKRTGRLNITREW